MPARNLAPRWCAPSRLGQERLFSWVKPLSALVLVALFAAPLAAQAPLLTPANPQLIGQSGAENDVARVLQQGVQLESQRRWSEAVHHYEDCLKRFPGRDELRDRLQQARAHYDVSRRYDDSSFVRAATTLSKADALSVYEDVLLKIQAHYVLEPQWRNLAERGADTFLAAVGETAFQKLHHLELADGKEQQLRTDLRHWVQSARLDDRKQTRDLIDAIGRTVESRYGIPAAAAVFEFSCGAVTALDEYSGFLTTGQMEEVFSQIEGNFVGLGVELKTQTSGLVIVSVIPQGPADLGGIRPGETIVEVDGNTIQMASADALADMLRGEEGSLVSVGVVNAEGDLRRLKLTRRRVEVPSVESIKIIDPENGIGYFRLSSFQKTTTRDVDAALWKLHDLGMRSLIIDLRGNPGGLLKAAVEVADRFVGEGLIVSTRGRSPREDYDHRGQIPGTWRVPLVLLVDHDSASASEILAGAVRDHRRGTLVGEQSFGKGSVQGIFPLSAGNSGVRLTTAKWYTPSGQAISGNGVKPDIAVQVSAKPIASGAAAVTPVDDPILQAGLKAAQKIAVPAR